MKKAVIYARYSCEKQNEQSIDGQIRVCKEFASSQNLEIINTYIDRALSGKTDKRPNFIKLIDDSKKNLFDYVIVYKLDRFARNRYDSVLYKQILNKNNVKVLSACEQIADSPEGIIIESLIEGMAEYYSAELSQKTKRGMKETILKGNFTGGTALFGYKVENKKIKIDEQNSKAIRYAFLEYANGKSFKKIAEELNLKGYLYNGKPFKASYLQGKLNNKKYIGINEYEGQTFTNAYPPIIDEDTFYKVQLLLKRNKHNSGSNKAKEDYILSGKLFCGLCGHTMVGTSGKSKKNKYLYYTCSNRYKNHNCNKEYEHKNFIENFVIENTLNYLLQPKRVNSIIDSAYTYLKQDMKYTKIKNIEQQLQSIEIEIDKIFDIFAKTNSEEIIKRANLQIASLEKQKSDLVQEYNFLKFSSSLIKTKEELKSLFDMFISNSKKDIEFNKKIVNLFINSIYIFEDYIVIYYNLFDNKPMDFKEMKETCEKVKYEKNNKLTYHKTRGARLRV